MEKAQEADAAGGPDGLLLIDKPAGLSSHDVVLIARRAYGQRSIGHLGTLDPFATGLLVLLLGRSTRLGNFLDIEPKVYEAVIRFGTETDSDDSTGVVTRTAPLVAEENLRQEIAMLTGRISQVPPDYSAKSVDGERAYKAARRGTPIVQQPVQVTVHSWETGELKGDSLPATITCSGGTYIRALARDLGRAVGSAAHLESLRRISMGSLNVRDAMSIEQLKSASAPPRKLHVVVAGG